MKTLVMMPHIVLYWCNRCKRYRKKICFCPWNIAFEIRNSFFYRYLYFLKTMILIPIFSTILKFFLGNKQYVTCYLNFI